LLAAAAACFARSGFAGTSVDDIAAHAGFSRGAFYSNFRSKDEVLILLLERHIEREMAAMAAERDQLESIEDLWRWLWRRQTEQPLDLCLLTSEFQLYARRNPGREAVIKHAFERRHAQLAEVVDSVAKRAGVVLPMDARRIVATIVGTLQGLMTQRLVEGLAPEGLEPEAIELMIAGIAASSRPAR
jgi:AcrR family transcriptional regulator